MQINYSKYHGCKNEFVCIDCRDQSHDLIKLVQPMCDRESGIGADGLIGLFESNIADFKMVIANCDGSIPEMCGNGIRCLAAYVIDQGFSQSNKLTFETGAGVLTVEITKNDINRQFKVQMGRANYGRTLPRDDFQLSHDGQTQWSYQLDHESFLFTPISMGNPHAVVFVDDVHAIDLKRLGPLAETHANFPNRVNTEFVQVVNESHLIMRVWERGVGETMACGTGACASVVAGFLTNQCLNHATVQLDGGVLSILFNDQTNEVIMTGPAEFIASGQWMGN